MGRKCKPTKLKVLEGNPGRRKLPENEPIPISDLPPPPDHLDEYARDEWFRICQGLYNMGLLFDVDRAAFAAYCQAYSRWKTAEEEMQKRVKKGGPLAGLVDVTKAGNIIQNTLVGIANKAAGDMVRYAAEFGLTPAARARLAIDPKKGKKGKFDGLIGAQK